MGRREFFRHLHLRREDWQLGSESQTHPTGWVQPPKTSRSSMPQSSRPQGLLAAARSKAHQQ
nr:MAG TPA: hypothetical protein [Caudoviricetes sp.]